MKAAVVGGGIAGLSAAWELAGGAEVTVFEPGRLGGRIRTEPFEGRPVETGPDAFITRVPDAVELCAEAGVDDLVAPSAGRTLIWWRGRLRPLPDGLVLGVPRKVGPVVRSGLLSPMGLLRAGADLVLPATPPAGDVSVHRLVAARFGRQVADRLVDPLVGGIHAGTIDHLSAEATVPQILNVAAASRSLLLGLRRSAPATAAGAIFATPRAGLTSLVDAVAAGLEARGARIETLEATGLVADAGGWRLEPAGERYDVVVVATPAPVTARLLGPAAPGGLLAIETASVALATFGYAGVQTPAGVNGILVPRSSGLLSTACSFASAKWPHWAGPGRTILRVSAGRYGDERAMGMGDDELAGRLADEVAAMTGWGAAPDTVRVDRWPHSFPQYRVGHLSMVAGVRSELSGGFPGVEVCGSSFDGAGIPACIRSGRTAARAAAGRYHDRAAP